MDVVRTTDAAAIILGGSAKQVEQLREQLTADPSLAESILAMLAAHPDVVVRGWVTGFATAGLPRAAAVRVLQRLIDDSDPDVRDEALRALVDLDQGWTHRVVPRYVKALTSGDVPETVDAIWRLVQFREPTAVAPIEDLAERSQHALIRNNATIALLVLAGDEDRLLAALKRHDHRSMPMWFKGLLYLGSPRALEALSDFARTGPDESCRRRAKSVLGKADAVRPIGMH